jgi:hypothetical protein
VGFVWNFLSNPLHKMNFLGGARGSKRLISQNLLLKIVSKKYGLMLRVVENKIEIIILSLFVGKKLEFSKNVNIFVILAYELHNRILILEQFDDFFFRLFKFFLKSF